MATVLFLMFKPCHKLRDFWKTLQLWDGNSCHHYVYRRGEPLVLHSEALTAKLLRYFLLITNLWLKETSLSLSSSVACRSKIVTEVAQSRAREQWTNATQIMQVCELQQCLTYSILGIAIVPFHCSCWHKLYLQVIHSTRYTCKFVKSSNSSDLKLTKRFSVSHNQFG
jgi:hypothetical protein